MKFTEGYWLNSERAHAHYAVHAYEIKEIPGGMQILAPERKINGRSDPLNITVLNITIKALDDGSVRMTTRHYKGYQKHLPSFEHTACSTFDHVQITISEKEACMDTGLMQVRVVRDPFLITFEANGKVLTSCGYHNLGYMCWNRKESTMFPESNYLSSDYTPYMMMELSLSVGEHVYGLGERFTSFIKNGQSLETWNEDGGTSSQIPYKGIPFYMTNKGYGVLVNSSDDVSFEVASEKVEYVGFSVPGESLSICFFYGPDPEKIIERYTALSGRPALPPAWSFGLWLSSCFKPDYDSSIVNSYLDGMEKYDIPVSVFHFDPYWMKTFHWCDLVWDTDVFPDVKNMLASYHKRGIRICLWINPYISQETDAFDEAASLGYLLMRADGSGIWQTDHWQPGMGIVDFTNPAATAWFSEKLTSLLDLGVDCFKTDFGERIPIDVQYYDGSDPHAMHNYYGYLYNKAVYQTLCHRRGNGNAVLFARSATVGGQKFPVHWGGDCFASYPSMAETLRGGLSFAMSGFAFWSHDISGFESTATPDLYKRWTAFGLLSSHSRLHGSDTARVPWLFDEESCHVLSFFTRLKLRLMPYIYNLAVVATEKGTPLMRPMVFEFPEDHTAQYLDTQYMLGDALLVAPVFSSDGLGSCYLPQGLWTHLLSGKTISGGIWDDDHYDYFSLPLFVRPNTLLPFGACSDRPDYEYQKHLTVKYYQPADDCIARRRIVSSQGDILFTLTALKHQNQITFTTDAVSDDLTLEIIIGDQIHTGILKAGDTSVTIPLS